MSARERIEWRAFEGEFGPLTLHERIDQAAALIALTVWRAAGHEAELADFLPRWVRESELPSAFDVLHTMARAE